MAIRSISNVISTWTSSGTSYTGLGINVYSTAYASDSKPFNIRVNGGSVFSVDPSGTLKANTVDVIFNTANAAFNYANNLAVASGDPSFAFKQANTASNTAIAAFNKANTSLQNTSGTFSGSLTVTGNFSTASRGISNASIPAGSILQVVNTLKTDSFGSSSASWVDVPGLSVTITPYFSTSKILVMVNCPGGRSGTGSDAYARLLRNGTLVGNGNSGYFTQWAGQYGLEPGPGSRTFMDSPGTTSALTYSVQVYTASDAIYIGSRRLNDFIFGADITVFEIAQ